MTVKGGHEVSFCIPHTSIVNITLSEVNVFSLFNICYPLVKIDERSILLKSLIRYIDCLILGGVCTIMQFAFVESLTRIPIPPANVSILTLPPFPTSRQVVKLESMATVYLGSPGPNPTDFEFLLSYLLYRDGTYIAFTSQSDIAHRSIEITPNITWVDVPPSGTHTYEIRIALAVPTGTVTDIRSRTLTATLYPEGQVLPSTMT